MTNDQAATVALQQMLGGPTAASLIYTAVELDLPELLGQAPATGAQLAARSGADPDALSRILRVLAGLGIVAPAAGGRYSLTPLGALLRRDVPGSAYRSARLMGHPAIQRAWTSLPHTAMTGQPAFDHAHGIDFMAYMIADADFADRFNEFMSEVTERVAAAVVADADFADAKTAVDVGGGAGALLRALLHAHPGVQGTIVDVALLREQAERSIAMDGLGDRCVFIAGDFFQELPTDADVYLLKSVLHDWDDDRALAVLATCRAALGEHSRLLIVESAVPDGSAVPFDVAMGDLIMLTMGTGRERTLAEHTALLERAGLRLRTVTPTGQGPAVLEATRS